MYLDATTAGIHEMVATHLIIKSSIEKCISFQIWLFWVAMLNLGGIDPVKSIDTKNDNINIYKYPQSLKSLTRSTHPQKDAKMESSCLEERVVDAGPRGRMFVVQWLLQFPENPCMEYLPT